MDSGVEVAFSGSLVVVCGEGVALCGGSGDEVVVFGRGVFGGGVVLWGGGIGGIVGVGGRVGCEAWDVGGRSVGVVGVGGRVGCGVWEV